jgi:uncharacterized protein (UPF0261 family)
MKAGHLQCKEFLLINRKSIRKEERLGMFKENSERRVLLVATLDTKGEEASYLASCLRALQLEPLIMDAGIRGEPRCQAHISREQIAASAGTSLEAVRAIPHEGKALSAMTRGAVNTALKLMKDGKIMGVISIGGSMGTTLGSSVMRALPLGFPKVMISTMASRDTRAFVGTRDICMLYSVADLAGLNGITRRVLANGAGAMAGMVASVERIYQEEKGGTQIALTTLGTTETAAAKIRAAIAARGFETVTFHSNGSGGRALEEMVSEGAFDVVADISLHELADHLFQGDYDAGPERGHGAIKRALPTVLVPGNVDFLVTGPLETALKRFSGRRLHSHNEAITVVETSAPEMEEMGRRIGLLANMAEGPVAVLVPMGGFSAFSAPGGPFFDPSKPYRFAKGLFSTLSDSSRASLTPFHINEEPFLSLLLGTLFRFTDLTR